jgi:DNA polymerase
MKVFLDIETRSRADLPDVGAARYAEDPTTEIFMAAVSTGDPDSEVYLWVNPKFRDAGVDSDPEALATLRGADEVHAHNADFERELLTRTDFEVQIQLTQWRCTQAMARIAALPDSLEKCGEALSIDSKKDKRGKDLIKFFSMPQEDGSFNEPRDHRDKWRQFCDYCKQDVRAEKQTHHLLDTHFGLRGVNLETFQFTIRMNETGIPVNVPALRNAQKMIDQIESTSGAEFTQLTGLKITQRAKVKDWLAKRGIDLPNMQAETLQDAATNLKLLGSKEASRAIELHCQLSYAATKKISTMLDWACADNRLHGVFKFYGAGTGRWSAGGPQLHNAKKATPEMRPITHAAYKYIAGGGSIEGLRAVYGEPIEVLASCIRHFVHLPGHEILDGDYNAIEARLACWVSNQDDALEEYRRGVDRYKAMAGVIYGKPVAHVTADEREVGKRAILGLAYGMGADKFRMSSLDQYGIDIPVALAERAKDAFREKHWKIVEFWRALDRGIRHALQIPGSFETLPHGISVYTHAAAGIPYLFIKLPSGRSLAYPYPEITDDPQFGTQITYWGQIPLSTQWGRIKLYGAKAFENICQAIAADIMAFGSRMAESKWMLPFALIHDQGLALKLSGQQAHDFSQALATLPQWANGLPLKVETKIAPYYSK